MRRARPIILLLLSAAAVYLAPRTFPVSRTGTPLCPRTGVTENCAHACHRTGAGERLKPGLEYFLRSRLSGNPDADIELLHRRAWESLRGVTLARTDADSPSRLWVSVGPSNIAGRIRALAFHPTDPAILYAGSATGGVFKSTDSGSSWLPMMDDPAQTPVTGIGALAIDRNNPELLFAGTGEPTITLSKAIAAPVGTGMGVLQSTDGGQRWSALPWPQSASAISRIALHPASSDTMLVGSRTGLWKTVNRGGSWSNTLAGVVSDVRYHESNPAIVFAASGSDYGDSRNGVYRSMNGGKPFSWQKLFVNFPAGDSTGRILLATTPADPRLLLALVARPITSDDFLALMRSTDAGDTWERVPTNLPPDFPLGQAFYNFCIAVSPVNRNLVFVGGIEVYRSTDAGSTFYRTTFANQVVHVDQHAFAFQPQTDALYAGNDGGVFRTSTKGDTWERRDATLVTTQFYSLAVDQRNPGRIFGGTQDNGTVRLSIPPDRWQIIRGDVDGGALCLDSNFLYTMGTLSVFPFRSTNGGQSWSSLREGLDPASNRPNWLQPLLLHPADKARLYTATQFVYEARDVNRPPTTTAWKAISPDLSTGSGAYESVVTALAIAPSDGNVMYAGTGDGRVHRTTSLLAAMPGWTDVSGSLPKRWVTSIAVDPADHRTAFVTLSGFGSGHVFVTTDAGDHWKDVSGAGATGLPDVPANALLLSPQQRSVVFLATDLGVFWMRYPEDEGIWQRIARPLDNTIVTALAIDITNRLYAATHGRGVWMTDGTVGVSRAPLAATMTFTPMGVRPLGGPAGTTAQFSLSLPERAPVRVLLFDTRGKVIRIVVSEVFEAGRHVLFADLGDLPSGLYYCRLESRARVISHKVLLFR
ncbi:MAG: hypothetical protein IPP94_05720 [Ignavibacteria bacterium]|nr:hypothetical protein [Ignavibacteria bacterium]